MFGTECPAPVVRQGRARSRLKVEKGHPTSGILKETFIAEDKAPFIVGVIGEITMSFFIERNRDSLVLATTLQNRQDLVNREMSFFSFIPTQALPRCIPAKNLAAMPGSWADSYGAIGKNAAEERVKPNRLLDCPSWPRRLSR